MAPPLLRKVVGGLLVATVQEGTLAKLDRNTDCPIVTLMEYPEVT